MNNILNFRYHSTVDNNPFLSSPDPYHIGGINGHTDFGHGLYLSDDAYGSYIWGSRNTHSSSIGTMNVYDIDPAINNLNGLIICDDYSSVLTWAYTTGLYLDVIMGGYQDMCLMYLSEHRVNADQYDWILSRRTDDRMYSYLSDFFSNVLSFKGLLHAYDHLSFGDELVIKSPAAMKCLKLNENESNHFDKTPYLYQYSNFKENADAQYRQVLNDYAVSQGYLGIDDIVEYARCEQDWTQYV